MVVVPNDFLKTLRVNSYLSDSSLLDEFVYSYSNLTEATVVHFYISAIIDRIQFLYKVIKLLTHFWA